MRLDYEKKEKLKEENNVTVQIVAVSTASCGLIFSLNGN